MSARTDAFVAKELIPLFDLARENSVVIVAHGIILSTLWRSILHVFPFERVSFAPGLNHPHTLGLTLDYLGGWSNTGYLELEIRGYTAPRIKYHPIFKDVVPPVF